MEISAPNNKKITGKDQAPLHVKDLGKGSPVILIHGWPLNGDMWEYQINALLEAGHRVIAYDRRGFGQSCHSSVNFNYDVFADDLNEVIEQKNLTGVALVGFSMGGGEIARYLSKYGSAKVSKTVLIGSILPYLLKTDDNPEGVPEKTFKDMIQGLKEDRPKFLAGFTKDFFGVDLAHALNPPVSSEMMQWSQFMAFQASAKATIDCVTAFGKTDFRKDMAAFKVPTLIIHGTKDKVVPAEVSGDRAAKMIPNAMYRRYDGAPHGLFITHKNQLTEDLISFLGKN
ncbi:MAG: alpha/beta hydrolase [Bdellovibrionaceae bacterium]|nr:alpha/beta hydrolase [Pseudobdellovibrionaceae bacterium]